MPASSRPLDVLGVPGEINLDYAASAPCARAAADAVAELLPWYASVHRGAGALSRRCTLAYERARQTVGDFFGARADDHVIFTRNTTDALNLLARALPAGTTVVTFAGEHHANLLPWPRGSVRLPVPADPAGAVRALAAALTELRRDATAGPPVLVAVTGASNVTGERWPVAELARVAHRHGARIAVDAAQLAPHGPVDLAAPGLDYLAVSGHKLYAPFGAGVLVGRTGWTRPRRTWPVAARPPGRVAQDVTWAGPPRHEGGTPNLLGAVALAAACWQVASLPAGAVAAHEGALLRRLSGGLEGIGGVRPLRLWPDEADRIGVVSFTVDGWPAALVAQYLSAEHGIGVRDGRFCAHPLLARLNPAGTAVQPGTRQPRKQRRPAHRRPDCAGRPRPGLDLCRS